MRVLQINSVCGVGSTGRIATDLYKVLEEQGHECLIVYGRGAAPEGINAYKIGTDLDNYLHVARTRFLDQHGYGSKKPTMKLIEKIKEYNPDVIHLHNLHGYYLNLEILFNYLTESSKPVVWTLHDCWPFTGHCSHFEYVECNRWKTSCYNCLQKREYPASIFFDNSKENYRLKKELFTSVKSIKIVTPSLWLANLVEKSFLNQYDIQVIHNGIDLKLFNHPKISDFRKKYSLENKKIILGVANVWSERKGIDIFIKLSRNLNDEFKIVLVGVSDKDKKKLPSNIIGIAKTNSVQELAEIYSSADIFLNPTLEDNFPTVNLEALACGTPVFTYDTGGCSEIIDDSVGCVIPQNDFDIILQKINNYSPNNYLKEVLYQRSRNFDKTFAYMNYIEIYSDLIKQ